jgi:hypothetical protein
VVILFGSLPAFVVNGQNLMTDVPTLAFLLAGTAAIARSLGEEASSPWMASVWLSCAVFSSYQALAFLPVLLGFALCAGSTGARRRRLIGVLALPALLMFVWLLLVYVDHGIFPLLKSQARANIDSEILRGLQGAVFWPKMLFVLAMIGASLLFVLPIRCCRATGWQPKRDGLVLLALIVILFLLAPGETGTFPRRLALAFFGALGVFGLWLAWLQVRNWYPRQETRGLAALCGGWIGVTLLVNLFVLPFGSARYLLPLFPILFLVLLHGYSEPVFHCTRWSRVLLVCALAWGGINAWADYSYAATYRTMAAELDVFRQGLGNRRQIWYVGEWGMRHYFDQAGARYLLAGSTAPKPGDYVVIPEMPRFWAPVAELRSRLNFYASREFRSPLPLRLFNRRSGAGFYCHHWGMLPFTFSSEPDEVFVIQEVR